MQLFRLNDEYRTENNIKYLQQFNSTKELFYYEGDIARRTTTEERTQEEIEKLVESGKIAIFPIYAKQGIENIIGHIKMDFTIYFMSYSNFEEFKKKYIENCVNPSKVLEEDRQQEFQF